MSATDKLQLKNQLLFLIMNRRDKEAKLLLLNQEKLAKSCCDFEDLLKLASTYGNSRTARRLIELGAKVDCSAQNVRTPLMIAIRNLHIATVKVLLEANASIDVVNARGENALQMMLTASGKSTWNDKNFEFEIFEVFFQAMKYRVSSIEDFAEKLVKNKFSLFHASFSNDTNLLETMLNRGVDVNSRSYRGTSALYVAVKRNNLSLAKWLVKQGANVNALDYYGEGPLFCAASNRNKVIMQFLLDEGADPNAGNSRGGWYAPIFALFSYSTSEDSEVEAITDECVELLLQRGGVFGDLTSSFYDMLDYALTYNRENGMRFLLAHAAMYVSFDEFVDEGAAKRPFSNLRRRYAGKVEDYFELCRKALMVVVFEKMSLLDLLKTSESEMKVLVRKCTFVPAIEKFCCDRELEKLYRYYYINLTKYVAEATDALKFEDEAIVVISKLFNGNYNLCYNFAQNVVRYLGKRDVERLCKVYEQNILQEYAFVL